MAEFAELLQPGRRVAVTQQLAQRDRVWTIRVEGQVVSYEQQPTVSPFAHSRGGLLWLDRLVLRTDDGEVVVCNLDQYSHIEAAAEKGRPAGTVTGGSAQGQDQGSQ